MIRKESVPADYAIIQNKRRDYYSAPVRWDNWGEIAIKAIETVKNDTQGFLQMYHYSDSISEE